MSFNAVNHALAKQDWRKASEDMSALGRGNWNIVQGTSDEYVKKTSVGSWGHYLTDTFDIEPGEVITGRIYIKPENVRTWAMMDFRDMDNNIVRQIHSSEVIEPGEEGYSTVTATVPKTAVKARIQLRRGSSEAPRDTIYYKEYKIEKGPAATPWTPHPSEINARPFVADLAEAAYRAKSTEENLHDIRNAIVSLGGIV